MLEYQYKALARDITYRILRVSLQKSKDNEYMFRTNREGKEKTGQPKLPLTRDNQKLVLTMAGDIVKVKVIGAYEYDLIGEIL